jgi:hypothetical protein
MKTYPTSTQSIWRWLAWTVVLITAPLLTMEASYQPPGQTAPETSGGKAGRLEKENEHDQQVWQMTREMLKDLGYRHKAADLDNLWVTTHTPQQWAALRSTDWPAFNEFDDQRLAILELCRANGKTDFDRLFQNLCRSNPDLSALFTGLIMWTQQGGSGLKLQNKEHLALHFIYGGACEASLHLGYAAAVAKERLDEDEGGSFNLDEMAAGIAGAEWVHQARVNPDWVHEWATGQKTLGRNLPNFHRGDGEYSPQLVEQIHDEIMRAYAR